MYSEVVGWIHPAGFILCWWAAGVMLFFVLWLSVVGLSIPLRWLSKLGSVCLLVGVLLLGCGSAWADTELEALQRLEGRVDALYDLVVLFWKQATWCLTVLCYAACIGLGAYSWRFVLLCKNQRRFW